MKRFRSYLRYEYLAVSADILASRTAGGWLELWEKNAANNVIPLKGTDPTTTGRILPYGSEGNVKKQFMKLGVPLDQPDIVAEPYCRHSERKCSVTQSNLKKK
ncbi:MAG: hypothetical protein ACXVIU_12055 [Halobacteriota archaeon]